jgi:hypothetical protein
LSSKISHDLPLTSAGLSHISVILFVVSTLKAL